MGFKNETVTSISDFITKLDSTMSSHGWTSDHLDITTTAGTGGEWAMTRSSGATNIRFAASWDSENSGIYLGLYQYSDQAYVIGDRPWGQDHDSGNGFAGTTPDNSIKASRHVLLAAAPIQYWMFEDADYTHVVVEVSSGNFQHFGWGMLDKFGDWVGGEYCYGQQNNLTGFTNGLMGGIDTISGLLDGHFNDGTALTSGTELIAATIHAESLPNQTALGMWMISAGGKTTASEQSVFGSDRQSNDGITADIARHMFIDGLRAGAPAEGFYRASSGTDVSGMNAMWEIAPRYYDDTSGHTYGPMGKMKDIRGLNITNWAGGDEMVQGGDTWVIFPLQVKFTSGSGSSGNMGIAYKKIA